ncbi:MAG: transcriptional regulator [Gammaproteobacteria bacterium]|nr:transcriptional regulator [Gammaproteobacteria bacterium]
MHSAAGDAAGVLAAAGGRLVIEIQASPRLSIDSQEGTVKGPGGSVRLEPKVMDVLQLLSRHAGRVVSRNELMDAVWPDVVVTEHTLSRCVYQLRNQLGKIAGDPDQPLIETLPKRGYRLLADVGTITAHTPSPAPVDPASLPVIPYVIGQWVRAERFYGRTAQIAEILDGSRNCIWLLGTRRIGKTSLLKQLEYIADTSRDRRFFPLFWDFQGTATPGELHLNFNDALLDAEDRLERMNIAVSEVEADDLFVSLERLRRLLRRKEFGLLLLCDEVEELIELHRKDPSLLRKLRHAMQSREDIRTVLASTIRLWSLAHQKDDTSPFLHGFTPPLYIERFSDDEAQSLIEQAHLAPEQRPVYRDGDVEAIRNHCNNHPYLVQLVCKRYLETGDLGEAVEHVATDSMVSYFFSVDFDMLSDNEQDVIRMIAGNVARTSNAMNDELALGADRLAGTLRRLENLGFIRCNEAREFTLANDFFHRWLLSEGDDAATHAVPAEKMPANVIVVPPPVDKPSSRGFFAELRRRKVFRVAIAYVVVAWLLLQLGEILFDFLEVPTWAGKLLIAFLTLGLPVAIFLAWAFELTPEGVKRDDDIDRSG